MKAPTNDRIVETWDDGIECSAPGCIATADLCLLPADPDDGWSGEASCTAHVDYLQTVIDRDTSELAATIVATLTDEQLETAIGEGEARWKAGRWAIGDSIIMDALAAEWTAREERRVALEWEDDE